ILVDSLRKRIVFLQDVVEKLGLTNVECVHARAEDLAQAGAAFDLCTARAVARLDKLAKWVLPITKPGGTFLAMKGADVQVEVDEAKPVIGKLGGCVKTVDLVEIAPGLAHSVVVVEKAL
ncbi:MAG: class I SAM-dependent methyltransferase, partial [Defluviitaleaceae bacterium]|nr:class I SAM-dependent methyltransferase [Defluviitaleaceae bacterium]